MSTPIYKHRPSKFAISLAFTSQLFGIPYCYIIQQGVERGELGIEKLHMALLISIVVAGVFIILAFSRYQFTHLWVPSRRKPHGYQHQRKPSNRKR